MQITFSESMIATIATKLDDAKYPHTTPAIPCFEVDQEEQLQAAAELGLYKGDLVQRK